MHVFRTMTATYFPYLAKFNWYLRKELQIDRTLTAEVERKYFIILSHK